MSTTNAILQRVEDALSTYLIDQGLTHEDGTTLDRTRIYPGLSRGSYEIADPQDADTQAKRLSPCVQCVAASAEPDHPFNGNWTVSVEVILRSNSNDTSEAEHKNTFAAILALILNDGFDALLGAAVADFTVWDCIPETQAFDVEDDEYMSRQGLTIRCCGSDIDT